MWPFAKNKTVYPHTKETDFTSDDVIYQNSRQIDFTVGQQLDSQLYTLKEKDIKNE